MKKSNVGRPPIGSKPMGARLEIRIDRNEKIAYDLAAQVEGVDRSDWIRATLNAEAERVLQRKAASGKKG